jgi:hypothetical protein
MMQLSYHNKSAMVVEMAAIIQTHASVPVPSFLDFSKLLYNHIMKLTKGYQRCDIVCDRYLSNSIEGDVRDERGGSS